MKIGMVGAGHWSTPYAKAAQALGSEICCIYTPDNSGAELAQTIGSRTAASADDVFQNADCVLIGTPTDTHTDLLKKAAAAGKPILCASPAAASTEQLAELKTLTTAPVYCSFPFRARPEYQKLKSAMQAGDLGTIGMIRLGICLSRPDGWRAEVSRSGGAIIDSGVHAIDLLQWLSGKITRIYGAASKNAGMQYNLLMARTADDSIAHLEISWVEAPGSAFEYYEVAGSNGLLDYDTRREPLLVLESHGSNRQEQLFPGASAAQHELAAFLKTVAGEKTDFPTLAHGLEVSATALEVAKAVKNGAVLNL